MSNEDNNTIEMLRQYQKIMQRLNQYVAEKKYNMTIAEFI
jgi:hypothetical protein